MIKKKYTKKQEVIEIKGSNCKVLDDILSVVKAGQEVLSRLKNESFDQEPVYISIILNE